MSRVLLVYPYFDPPRNRSIFRFPPLGLAYVAAGLREAGHEVSLLDCTFLAREDAFARAIAARADMVGVYSMVTMRDESLEFARRLRGRTDLLVAGGPLPSCDPETFVDSFDVVVRGEGERAAVEILEAANAGRTPWRGGSERHGECAQNLASTRPEAPSPPLPGLSFWHPSDSKGSGELISSPTRPLVSELDRVPFPARDLFDHRRYLAHWRRRFGTATTTVMTTRGCPFHCEFCSNAVFGTSYRAHSAERVVDEVEDALSYGYGRIHFADDVFTLDGGRLLAICDEIRRRGLRFQWECLGRVDSIDHQLARAMRDAGCDRIFFGIESGSDEVLRLMRKRISLEAAARAVATARAAGLKVGAFFILCYPGETDETVLATLRFATRLPLDYLSFTMPYPLPHTALYERVEKEHVREWRQPRSALFDHVSVYDGDFSETKMRFGILKGKAEFALRRRLGRGASLAVAPFETATDLLFRVLR